MIAVQIFYFDGAVPTMLLYDFIVYLFLGFSNPCFLKINFAFSVHWKLLQQNFVLSAKTPAHFKTVLSYKFPHSPIFKRCIQMPFENVSSESACKLLSIIQCRAAYDLLLSFTLNLKSNKKHAARKSDSKENILYKNICNKTICRDIHCWYADL